MKISHTKIEATDSITCSALDAISGFLKKVSTTLWNGLLSIQKDGLQIDRAEKGKDGIFYLRAKTKRGNPFVVKCSPVKGKQSYDLSFLTQTGVAPDTRLDVAEADIPKVIGKWAHEFFNRDSGTITELTDEEGSDKLNPASTTAEDSAQSEEPIEPEPATSSDQGV